MARDGERPARDGHAPRLLTGDGSAPPESPQILRRLARPLVQASCASFLEQCLGLVPPLALLLIIDRVIVNSAFETLDVIALAVVIAAVFEFAFSNARERFLERAATGAWSSLAPRVYQHLLYRPPAAVPATEPAEGTTVELRAFDEVERVRAFDEVERVRAFVARHAAAHVTDIAIAALFSSLLLLIDARLALIAIVGIPLYAVIVLVTAPALRRRTRQVREGRERSKFVLNETLVNFDTVRALALEKNLTHHWQDAVHRLGRAQARLQRLSSLQSGTTELAHRLLTAAALWFGAGLVVAQEITLGQLVAFNLIAMRLSAPILRASRLWPELQRARDAIRYLEALLREPVDTGEGRLRVPERATGEIRFHDVTVRYPRASAPALEAVELRIAAGEFVALVGASGAGKSTLLRALLGLAPAQRGAVLIDGLRVEEIDGPAFRSMVGVVPQQAMLFTGSVRDNIALGDPTLGPEDIAHAAELAGAREFIERLPDGYLSFVGERGSALSGGQRQRIALARALARDPPILVLDEATSALDYEEEAAFFERVEATRGARTIVAATHRLAAVAGSDRIAVLRGGRLVETGAHAELLRAGGEYRAMWSHWLPERVMASCASS